LEAHIAAEFYPTVFIEQYDGLLGKFRPTVYRYRCLPFNPKTKDDVEIGLRYTSATEDKLC